MNAEMVCDSTSLGHRKMGTHLLASEWLYVEA